MTGNRGHGPSIFAVLAGGGTGGHTYPALALAGELVARGHPRDAIRFVGSRRGIEARVVPEAGYTIELLPGRGLQRRVTLTNVRVVWEAFFAFVRAWRLLGVLAPRVVVGFGGYASLPTVTAARLRRIPTVVHDQDAAPGLANRIAVRLGARAAISIPGTPLPDAVLTGNPVRIEVGALQRIPESTPLLAAFGGSLGARRINDSVLGLYERWRHRTDVAVHHVTGPRNFRDCAARLAAARRNNDALQYELVDYEEHMEQLLARTSLAVCRAGAGTVAELTAAGVPAVFVPLPGAPSDHQTANARALVSAGAATMIADADLDAARLDREVTPLLHDPQRRTAMGEAARRLGHRDAAARLADLVEELADAAR